MDIATHPPPDRRWIFPVALTATALLALLALDTRSSSPALVLAVPAFLAGLLSFLSPCCLPMLTAYLAYAGQVDRSRLTLTTLLFFLGLATTLVVLGATATAISRLLFLNLALLTTIGGIVIVLFGMVSLVGGGFRGPRVTLAHRATLAGSYLYGATFALGWSACVGPILGALLTMLATQGLAVVQGAALALVYALGLGTPLFAVALLLDRIDRQGRFWQTVRGRGFVWQVAGRTLHLHTTSLLSGALLILVGVLLASGQLAAISRWGAGTGMTQTLLNVEDTIRQFFLGR